MKTLNKVLALTALVACGNDVTKEGDVYVELPDIDLGVDDVLDSADMNDSGEPPLDTADSGFDTGMDTGDIPDEPVDPPEGMWFAPYVDATAYPFMKLDEVADETGVNQFVLAFIVADTAMNCTASWGTYYDLETGPSAWEDGGEIFLYDHIDELRADGGEVMVSFGGAANTPLAAGGCDNAFQLAEEYDRVMETMNTVYVDFDVEGYWVADPSSIDLRSQALAELQSMRAARGEDTQVWLTLPVMPYGLTSDGLNVVESAVDWGVDLAGVNVMTMNYGEAYDGDMGERGIEALESLHVQLNSIYAGTKSESELWSMLGTTPMIGQNDVSVHFFELEDAEETMDFALLQGLGFVSFWSMLRDQPCEEVTPWATFSCHGETEDYAPQWAYTEAFLSEG